MPDQPNRAVRTRMLRGVGGRSCEAPSYPDGRQLLPDFQEAEKYQKQSLAIEDSVRHNRNLEYYILLPPLISSISSSGLFQ